ncbi:MAG: DUF6691 family protein [Pseudomonadota bacterium]
MTRALSGLVSGLLFGLGLVISGMADPAKVLNFLDIGAFWLPDSGGWDPSLAFVMAGAVVVTALGYRLAWQRATPVLGGTFDRTVRSQIDHPLIVGAAIFGIGWGLSGYCPGPAMTAIPLAATGTLVFLPCLLIGLWLGRRAGAAPLRVPVEA